MTIALAVGQLPAMPTASISELLLRTTLADPANEIPVAVRLRSVTPESVRVAVPLVAIKPPPNAGAGDWINRN